MINYLQCTLVEVQKANLIQVNLYIRYFMLYIFINKLNFDFYIDKIRATDQPSSDGKYIT